MITKRITLTHADIPYTSQWLGHDLTCQRYHIAKRRLALFGHVVRLNVNTPARQILKQAMGVKPRHRPNEQWRRRPGRQRNSWLQWISNGSLTGVRQSWRAVKDRGQSRVVATGLRRLCATTTTMMMSPKMPLLLGGSESPPNASRRQ